MDGPLEADMKGGRVSGVLLAAGASARFGNDPPKQLAPFLGEPLVRRAVRRALASRIDELVLVVGFAAEAVTEAVADLAVEIVRNVAWAEGQGTSVAAGLRASSRECTAVLFLNADQPWMDRTVIDRILGVHGMAREAIVVPTLRGRRRSPVLFPDRFFPELSALGGDTGGRQLFERHAGSIVEVEFASEAPFEDIDNREDLSRLESRHPASGSPEA